MKNKRTTRFLFLISLLIFPILLLGILSFRSIRNSAIVIETQYYDQLDQVFHGIEEETHKISNEITRNLNLYTIQKLQLGTTLTRLSRSIVDHELPGLEGISVWEDRTKIYPSLNFSTDNSISLINSESLPDFEKKLLPLQHRSDLKKKFLQERLAHSQIKNLKPLERELNDLGIIKLFFQLQNYSECIQRIKRFQKTYQKTTLYLDLLQVKSYTKLNKYSQAYQVGYSSFVEIFEKKNSVDFAQAQYVLSEMYAHLLSDQNLKEDERKNLWTLNENINRILNDAKVYSQHQLTLGNLVSKITRSKENSVSLKTNNTWYLVHKFNFEGQDFFISSIWDLNKLNPWLIKKLNIARPTWKNNSFQFYQNQKLIVNQNYHKSNIVYNELSFPNNSPLDGLKIFKPQESEIQKMIQTRSGFLYGLLFVSFILIIIGAVFVLRALQKEQKLLGMKSNFLSSITHELKTPLTSIKMFSEMMQAGRIKTPEKTQEYGALIHKETHRLQLMVDDILNYSQIDQGVTQVKLQNHNVINTFNNIITRITPIADSKNISLNLNVPSEAYIEADPQYLESLLQNLIDNAIKYSPNDSSVSITLSSDETHHQISVKDNGIGISKHEQKYIFDLFYRVGDEMTRKTKGSGLGLAIAQSIAKLHNTQITLQSDLHQGSTFSIKFRKANHA